MAAGVGRFKQDILERLAGMERTVVIQRGPERGVRLLAFEHRVIRGI